MPRATWQASKECRDVARPAFMKACADVRELRAAIESLAAIPEPAPGRQLTPAQTGQHPAVADPTGNGRTGWVLLGLLLLLVLAAALCIAWIADLRDKRATRRVASMEQDPLTRPNLSDAPSPSRASGEGGDNQPGTSASPHRNTARRTADTARSTPGMPRFQGDPSDGDNRLRTNPPSWENSSYTLAEAVDVWMGDYLVKDGASQIAARAAFESFCAMCAEEGWRPPSETAFGRELTAQIGEWGGRKVKKRERAYYQGVAIGRVQWSSSASK